TGIPGAAPPNNDVPPPGMATGTTLYDVDTMRNQVVVQSPPNGVPMAIAPNLVPTGNLGLDPDPAAGFDIYSAVVNGAAVDNLGFAVLNQGASSGFYSVSFQTGQA